jgi:DNA-binding CsgD family transcriptional regulator/tetratricopeptide (TPR) repeat protein
MGGSAGGGFVGRGGELAVLRQSLAAAGGGRPQIVVVDGEPGVGKTALLRRFVREAPGVPVVWASGDATESGLEFGVARQLLMTLPLPSAVAAGGGVQGRFSAGVAGGGSGADGFSVGAALLAGVGALEMRGPAVVVVDDLHWIDAPSARALLFFLRRLRADPVLVLLAARPQALAGLGESWARLLGDPERTRWVRLAGLTVAQVRELAAAAGRELAAEAGARLQQHTGGNPLYVSALLAELADDALAGAAARLPAPRAYAATVLARLSRLPGPARALVCAVAVAGMRCPARLATAVAGLGEGTAGVEEAVRAGLLDLAPGTAGELVFAHPLMRAAVYDDLAPGRRRRLHLAAAALTPPPASFAHRVAAAAAGFDDALAGELIVAAGVAQAAGGLGLAGRYLGWAARVDGDQQRAEASLFEAAGLLLMTGDVHAAEEHMQAVAARPASQRRRFTLALHAAMARGQLDHARAELTSVAEAVSPEQDAALFGYCAGWLALVCAGLGADEEALRWAQRARAAAGQVPAIDALAVQALAWSYAHTGRIGECLRLLGGYAAQQPAPSTLEAELVTVRGVVRDWAGDVAGAAADLRAVLGWQRRGVSTVLVTDAYAALAESEFRGGDWDAAATHVELAVSLGADLDHITFLSYAHSVAALLYAARGDDDAAAAHAGAAQHVAGASPSCEALACAALARAHVAWGRADWPAVAVALQPLHAGGGAGRASAAASYPNLALWRYRLAEARIAAGRLDEARELLNQTPPVPWGGTTAADRARLDGLALQRAGRPGAAAAAFAAAMPGPQPVSRSLADGLLALDYGRLLIAGKHRRAAAAPLLTARAIFAGLGAARLLAACDRALLACGVSGPPVAGADSRAARLAALTPHEQVVAKLVAAGMTNRQVAAELYVSVKAVEYHLGGIFAKLGIRSRRELPAELAGPRARAAAATATVPARGAGQPPQVTAGPSPRRPRAPRLASAPASRIRDEP